MAERLSSSKLWLLVIGVAVAVLPIFAWGTLLSWQFDGLDAETIFPLLGMLAFSLIWLQLLVGAFEKHFDENFIKVFYGWSGWVFLLLIIGHPLLLAVTMNEITGEFSLGDLDNYVSDDGETFITIAIVALIIFVGYELVSRLKKWRWYSRALTFYRYLNYVGFYLIFIHSLGLGTHLQEGLMRGLWFFYIVSGTIFIVKAHWPKPV